MDELEQRSFWSHLCSDSGTFKKANMWPQVAAIPSMRLSTCVLLTSLCHADLRGKRSGSCKTEAWRQKWTGGEAFNGIPIGSTQCRLLSMSINRHRIDSTAGCFKRNTFLLQLRGRAATFSRCLLQTNMGERGSNLEC